MRDLWRAVDHEREALGSFVTMTRGKAAALKFMKTLMKRHGCPKVVTADGLRSNKAAMKDLNIAERQAVEWRQVMNSGQAGLGKLRPGGDGFALD
jgi:putative transposase